MTKPYADVCVTLKHGSGVHSGECSDTRGNVAQQITTSAWLPNSKTNSFM